MERAPSHTAHRVYRCAMPTRDRSSPAAAASPATQPMKIIAKLTAVPLSLADAAT